MYLVNIHILYQIFFIHLDQLEFLPIFPYSELLIWMLPAPNVTDHSYFDSVYLKVFTALSFLAN